MKNNMEVSILFATCTIVIGLAITTLTWKVANWVWFKPKKVERDLRRQGLNGNPYRILYGDVKDIQRMIIEVNSKPIHISDDISSRVAPDVVHAINKYGKDSLTWFGPIPRVIISNPEEIKEVFSKFNNYRKPQLNPLVNHLLTGLVKHEDQKWAMHRKIINPAFHMEKLKGMLPAIQLSSVEMLNKWESLVKDGQGSCEIDVWPHLQNMTGDVISRTAFGRSYEDGRRIFQLITELALLVFNSLQIGYFPGKRFVPTKLNVRLNQVNKEIEGLLRDMIRKREKAMKSGEAPNNDLLGMLMESNQKEIKEHGNKKNVGMTIQDVIDECKLFYFAGQETTSVLLTWTMVMLSHHPDWQDRAREEVLNVFENNNPDFDGLVHLKVVTMILNEVLRLFPPVPLYSRVVEAKTQIGKLCLPAGTLVSLPAVLVHYSAEFWGSDAKEFKPERFAGGVSEATKGKLSFIPFGWGPRICIGQNFAIIEAKLALALILQRFTFELSPSYTHAPINIITVQPQHGAHLIVHKRSY